MEKIVMLLSRSDLADTQRRDRFTQTENGNEQQRC